MSPVALLKSVAGEAVSRGDSAALLRAFTAGDASAEQLAAFLTALRIRGESAEALAGLVEVLRETLIPVPIGPMPALDLCGTGGDGQATVNLSTAAAFVAAAAGVPVAKHGNHGVSSRTGSADVLAALGVPRLTDPASLAGMLGRIGIAFIHAPAHHPLFARLAPLRRQLGFRTAFNLLGPLCNPAGVKRQVIGVSSPELLGVLGQVLLELGTERALLLHSPGPYDEVSLTVPARALRVEGGKLCPMALPPEAFGATPLAPEVLKGGDAAFNAQRIESALQGRDPELASAICANAACALFIADRAGDVKEGYALAQRALIEGRALALLQAVRSFQGEEADHDLAV